MFFPFSSCRSPPLGAGGDLGIFATPTVAQDCVTPCFPFFGGALASPPLASLFRQHILDPPPLSGDMVVVFLDVFLVLYG